MESAFLSRATLHFGDSAAVTGQAADPALFTDPEVLRVYYFDTAGHAVNRRFALSYSRGVVPDSAMVSDYGPGDRRL